MRIVVLLIALLLSACSMNEVQVASELVNYTSQAIENHKVVVGHIKDNKHIFSESEKEILLKTANEIEALKTSLKALYESGNLADIKEGTEAIRKYRELRYVYTYAIGIIEVKLDEFDPVARYDIERQIDLVMRVDGYVKHIIEGNSEKSKAIESLFNIVNLIAKASLAAV